MAENISILRYCGHNIQPGADFAASRIQIQEESKKGLTGCLRIQVSSFGAFRSVRDDKFLDDPLLFRRTEHTRLGCQELDPDALLIKSWHRDAVSRADVNHNYCILLTGWCDLRGHTV